MRTRKTWGILGSFMGIAGSMAVLAYSTIGLMALTSPASASPPGCFTEQLELSDAIADETVYRDIYTVRQFELGVCYLGGGSCLVEQLNASDAYADYITSVDIRQAKEFALAMCQSQF